MCLWWARSRPAGFGKRLGVGVVCVGWWGGWRGLVGGVSGLTFHPPPIPQHDTPHNTPGHVHGAVPLGAAGALRQLPLTMPVKRPSPSIPHTDGDGWVDGKGHAADPSISSTHGRGGVDGRNEAARGSAWVPTVHLLVRGIEFGWWSGGLSVVSPLLGGKCGRAKAAESWRACIYIYHIKLLERVYGVARCLRGCVHSNREGKEGRRAKGGRGHRDRNHNENEETRRLFL